jgi:hypothetical protein
MDIGTGQVIELTRDELVRRQKATNSEGPLANVHIPGYDRDRLMSTHRSNHITLCYGNIAQELASSAKHLGIPVNIIGDAREEFT